MLEFACIVTFELCLLCGNNTTLIQLRKNPLSCTHYYWKWYYTALNKRN